MEELNRCSPSNSSWKANGGTSNRLPIMTVVMVKVVITKGGRGEIESNGLTLKLDALHADYGTRRGIANL
ncbi:hypothetical protein J2Z18_004451 [Paenibacillus lactis]|uniref:Uncharacterized protein n=2 Tax=Paenibacillus lactis TaxID=228574 RepID=G4HG04_9BACL|nr:hypothetical protein PaelaDRAFT_3129 [Paenibacillus lactis 154]MBP1895341.1 hypothetical protein [Paenibacillus lactis]